MASIEEAKEIFPLSSKAGENRDGVFDLEKGENCSSVVTKQNVFGAETVVDSTFDINSGLVDVEVENGDLTHLSLALESDGAKSHPLDMNDVFEFNEHIDDGGTSFLVSMNDPAGEVACTEIGEKGGKCSGKQEINGEKTRNLNGEFHVGDFVWVKISSNPWWPAQIYSSNDASDFAAKNRQEGHLLVVSFGDGSSSWCMPSQLVPFVENFKQMSADSSSKNLLNAIQSAVSEIGRLVEDNMTCKCVVSDRRDRFGNSMVSNSEIEKGIVLPDVDIRRLSLPEYCPDEILKFLASYAKEVSFDCLLELSVVKSWLSAFYCAKDSGHGLPAYCEPVYIEGLEDKNKGTGDFSVPIEVPVMGPCEDDFVISLAGDDKSQALLDDKRYQRKQKSVAELMAEGDSLVKNRAKEVKKEKRIGKSASSGKRRNSDDNGEKVARLSKGKTGRKRNEIGHSLENLKEIKVDVVEDSSDEAKEEVCIISSPRERKKSKYLSPPYTNPEWSVRNLGSGKSFTKTESSTSPSVISESTDDIELKEESDTSGQGQTSANDKKLTFSVSDVDVQVVEWLLDVQFAAVDPFYLSKKGCLDTVWAFASALRSSTYMNGTDHRKFNSSGKKRKSLRNQESVVFSQEKVKSGDDAKPPKSKKKKAEGKKSNTKKSKKNKGNVSTCLILTFTPGFPLPSKEEIVGLFGKFGSLDENETNVIAESRSVRIVYTKESDAEVAFRSSIAESPFDVENVSYWLQHLSGNSESNGAFEKDLEPSKEKDEFMSDVGFIRKKLEMMTSILGNNCSEFSAEEKSSLKDEMKNLMEDVDAVSERVRVMAEKSSS